jgi:hypothetical protein
MLRSRCRGNVRSGGVPKQLVLFQEVFNISNRARSAMPGKVLVVIGAVAQALSLR